VWLPVNIAVGIAVTLGGAGFAIRPTARQWLMTLKPVLRECAVVLVLYAAWRQLGEVSIMGVERARSRGASVWHLERRLHLPNEATIQHWLRHAPVLLRFANAYYIVFHVAPLGIFLVWLFFRHRDRYPPWRNILGFASLACLLIQLVPVAPPRMYPQFGFIDAGQVYGPAVYDATGYDLPGQLAAMPSMHVLWAVVIGVAVVRVSPSRWRWLALAHTFLTVYAVTVTGYHWLLDGIVGAALVGIAMLLGVAIRRLRARRDDQMVRAPDDESARADQTARPRNAAS